MRPHDPKGLGPHGVNEPVCAARQSRAVPLGTFDALRNGVAHDAAIPTAGVIEALANGDRRGARIHDLAGRGLKVRKLAERRIVEAKVL